MSPGDISWLVGAALTGLGVYGLLVGWEVPIVPLMTGFGLLVATALGWLTWRSSRAVTPPAAGGPASP